MIEHEHGHEHRCITIEVSSIDGYQGGETPRSFVLGERTVPITEILDRWYEPDGSYYRVRGGDGDLYIIWHNVGMDFWELRGFRVGRRD